MVFFNIQYIYVYASYILHYFIIKIPIDHLHFLLSHFHKRKLPFSTFHFVITSSNIFRLQGKMTFSLRCFSRIDSAANVYYLLFYQLKIPLFNQVDTSKVLSIVNYSSIHLFLAHWLFTLSSIGFYWSGQHCVVVCTHAKPNNGCIQTTTWLATTATKTATATATARWLTTMAHKIAAVISEEICILHKLQYVNSPHSILHTSHSALGDSLH